MLRNMTGAWIFFHARGGVRRGAVAGLSRSVTTTQQKRVHVLQIEMLSWLPGSLSRSVTVRVQKPVQILQIETDAQLLEKDLNL